MAFHPMDNFRDRLGGMAAHPFQTIASFGAGALVPGGGIAAGKLFDGWNNRQFNNSVQQNQQRQQDMGNNAMNRAMDKPLNGPLGQQDNSALAGAMLGSGGRGGWNQNQGSANNNWSNPGNPGGLLDFLGPPPSQQQGSFFTNPAYAPQPNSSAPTSFQGSGAGNLGGGGGGSMGGLGGMGGNGLGASLPGGGYGGYMNGASAGMMSDFAAPTNGDYHEGISKYVRNVKQKNGGSR